MARDGLWGRGWAQGMDLWGEGLGAGDGPVGGGAGRRGWTCGGRGGAQGMDLWGVSSDLTPQGNGSGPRGDYSFLSSVLPSWPRAPAAGSLGPWASLWWMLFPAVFA